MLISEEIIHEYEEILNRYSAPGVANLILEIFLESADVVYQRVYYNWNAITIDPDDNKFFDVAVAANADYIVTNDTHFDVLKNLPFPTMKIIKAVEFLEMLNK